MSSEQQFCLRWNNFQVNITSQFEALRDDEDFVDVTLACDGKRLKAHKVVLSACSPYFKDLFKSNPCKHPILFMRDVEFHHLQSLVEFMYAGEVNIAQAQLSAFLRTAESLQIRGLTEAPQRHKQMDFVNSGGSHGRSWGGSSRQTSSPGGGSHAPSPEEGEQEAEEEVLSLSPPGSPTPPSKRMRTGEKSNTLEHTEDSGSVGGNARTSHSEQYENVKNEFEMVEPKIEMPDYCSDGEGRADMNAAPTVFPGMDNSVDMHSSFQGLQGGGMEIIPGTSGQNYVGDTSQDPGQADQRKLHSLDPRPCPICYRMYSNLSNLRQHLRLIHNPQTVACPLCSKPFKTKLYLKRHLMSFHELICTTPKSPAASSSVGVLKGTGSPEFFPAPQITLGVSSQLGDDRNGVQNPTSPSKPKDSTSSQEVVPEYFQYRGSYQGSKVSSGYQGPKAKPAGHNEERNNYQVGHDSSLFQGVKEERAPFHLMNTEIFRHLQASKVPDTGNFSSSAVNNDNRFNVPPQQPRNTSGDRQAQYHPQGGNNNQEGTPSFLNLLSLTKNEENTSFLNTQSHANENEKCSENENIDNTNSDAMST